MSRFSAQLSAARPLSLLAGLALMFAFPALAGGQELSPTDEQYECGVLGINAEGGECDPKGSSVGGEPEDGNTQDGSDVASAGSGSSGDPGAGSLPFTGLDLGIIAAIGVALIGAGFAVRHAGPGGGRSSL